MASALEGTAASLPRLSKALALGTRRHEKQRNQRPFLGNVESWRKGALYNYMIEFPHYIPGSIGPPPQIQDEYVAITNMLHNKSDIEIINAAEQEGNSVAKTALAWLYLKGDRSLPMIPDAAIYWFTQASNAGSATADLELARIYFDGSKARDYPRAIHYWKLAAEKGNPSAELALGVAYEEGSGGLKKNLAAAYTLYTRAASRGYKDAIQALKEFTVNTAQGGSRSKRRKTRSKRKCV